MPGPVPKPDGQRRRRNSGAANVTRLPAKGRKGDPPHWPLSQPTNAELSVWAEAWATPQAVAWETLGWSRAIARYCRLVVVAEQRDAPSRLLAEVRQLESAWGLAPTSMLRLRWQIVDDETANELVDPSAGDARQRLRAID